MLPTVCHVVPNVLDALQVIEDMPLAVLLVIDTFLFVTLLHSLSENLHEDSNAFTEGPCCCRQLSTCS